ncbi:MAG TPA: galactose oxidase [Methylomirabilota bacterium]
MGGLLRPGVAVALLALVGLTAGCVGRLTDSPAPIDQRTPGRWTLLTPMPAARQEVAVAAQGGRIWVIGGFGSSAEPVATVETYDPALNVWEARAPFPVPVHHAAAATVGERLFVFGGFTGGRVRWTALDNVYEFVPAREAWEPRAAMPTARGALAVAVLDGRVHALGGSAERVSNAHEVYDPATDRWTAANAMPTARDHLAAVGFQGRVWALGGRTSFIGDQYANVEIYDPASDSWRTGTPLPVGRGGLAAVALPDRILVFGGEAPLRIFNATEMWEVAGQRWIAKEPMPTARHGIGAAVVDGRVFVPAGGSEPGYAATTSNEAYTP